MSRDRMSTTPPEYLWLHRPIARFHQVRWTPPPPPNNPRLNGVLLVLAAKILAAFDFIKSYLWHNAGLGILNNHPALEGLEPRYDPIVTKTTLDQLSATGQHDLVVADANLLKQDWSPKSRSGGVYSSVLDYHEAYLSGRLTPTAVAEAILPLIRRDVETPSPHATAFLQSRVDLVMAAAEASTKRYQRGQPLSPLDGVPVSVKDQNDVTGYNKCDGTNMNFKHPGDVTSWCAQRLIDAGAVMVGTTNMHEMGMDTTNNNSNPNCGTPVNPHNERYYTGGSSGGSGYAVSAGLTPVSIGNDGGGSIRIPSAYCGIYGLKPTHGRVSISPSTSTCKSTSVAGPMAAKMVDLEISWQILAQPNASDPNSRAFMPPQTVPWPISSATAKIPLGVYKPWFELADPVVASACREALSYLTTSANYILVDISLPLISEGQVAHAMTILNEGRSSLTNSQIDRLTPANQMLFHIGGQTTASFIFQAQRVRNVLMQHLAALFEQHPGLIIMTPTTPNAGWHFRPRDLTHGVLDANMQLRNMAYVWLANFTGCPAITCPVGYASPAPEVSSSSPGDVPIGLMGMAEWSEDESLITLGYDLERFMDTQYAQGRRRPMRHVDVMDLAATKGA